MPSFLRQKSLELKTMKNVRHKMPFEEAMVKRPFYKIHLKTIW
ncbi:hypothetical protein DBT_2424 [Dissulfuribacter thermophilus]|uniref:Uncharacterized protein n=1 Tax=Dissulfuribacter thermophilus TaxID=1156395 RepID=A0A1B9F2K7_9BACT|nr:hypothetical protein DBT_2424 [Dissulfuribacter thermophilus]